MNTSSVTIKLNLKNQALTIYVLKKFEKKWENRREGRN